MSTKEFSFTFSKQLSDYLHKDLPDTAEDPFYGLKDKLNDLESQKQTAEKQISDLEEQLVHLKSELQNQLQFNNDIQKKKKSDSVIEFDHRTRNMETTAQTTDMQVQYDDTFEELSPSESLQVEAPSTRLSKNEFQNYDKSDQINSNEDHFAQSIDEYVYKTHEDIQSGPNPLFNSSIHISETSDLLQNSSIASPSPDRKPKKSVTIAKESIGIEASPKTKTNATMTSNHEQTPPSMLAYTFETQKTTSPIKEIHYTTPTKSTQMHTENIYKTPQSSNKPPFIIGTTPTTYSVNALMQQKRSLNKLTPYNIPETITSLTRKNYNKSLKHPKEENLLKRVILALEDERLILLKYAKDVTLIKLKVFKPNSLTTDSVHQLYSEFNLDTAPSAQKLLELKVKVRRVTAQPALERIIQKEFEYFYQVTTYLYRHIVIKVVKL